MGETEKAIVLDGINHNAPVHLLTMPKKRFNTVLGAPSQVVAETIALAVKRARKKQIDQSGFCLGIKANPQSWQTV